MNLSTRTIMGALCALVMASSSAVAAYADEEKVTAPLYRNGGHFGPAMSDQSIEYPSTEQTAPPAPSKAEPSPMQATYSGTRYRNGGHFGDKNSDNDLETPGR